MIMVTTSLGTFELFTWAPSQPKKLKKKRSTKYQSALMLLSKVHTKKELYAFGLSNGSGCLVMEMDFDNHDTNIKGLVSRGHASMHTALQLTDNVSLIIGIREEQEADFMIYDADTDRMYMLEEMTTPKFFMGVWKVPGFDFERNPFVIYEAQGHLCELNLKT